MTDQILEACILHECLCPSFVRIADVSIIAVTPQQLELELGAHEHLGEASGQDLGVSESQLTQICASTDPLFSLAEAGRLKIFCAHSENLL